MNFKSAVKFLLVVQLIFLARYTFSQQIYGNEWINPNQTYYSIKLAQNGVYKITYNQLLAKIGNLDALNPKLIQLYKNGTEQAVYISGEADLKFDVNDYLLFYGSKNDGKLDVPLYENPSFQPNPFNSLYTDSSTYFLTIGDIPGKRLTLENTVNNISTSENSISVTSLNSFANNYYGGAYVLAQTSESEYRQGEGLAGNLIGKGSSATSNLATPNQVAGTPITFSFALIGRSNASSANSLGHNHHYKVEMSTNNSSFFSIADSSYRSYALINKTKLINGLTLDGNTQVRLNSIDDLSALTDYQAPSFYKIDYQRNLDIQNISSLSFEGSYNTASLFKFTSSDLNKPFLIDFNNNKLISGLKNGSDLRFVIQASQKNSYYLFDENNVKSASLELAKFAEAKDNTVNDFIIITHKSLLTGADAYKTYRAQTGYNPLVVTTDYIFNEFYYGVNHPLAIRNFVQYLQDKSPKVKYILLLGKGIGNYEVLSDAGKLQNLVPTIGIPPSDNMYSAPLYGNNLAPKLAISRLPALNNKQISDYIEKLKEYEKKPEDISRKNIIHISGGSNLSDNLSWSSYQESFGKFAKNGSIGANIVTFKKNVSLPITTDLQQKIVTEIDKGANFLSFLGHGSAFATEINFGEPNELAQNSLLTYMINGCLAGNPNTLSSSIGENYLFEPGRGAVGWIATSDEGVASYLSGFSRIFYKNSYQDNYGKSIAQNLAISLQEYQNPSDILNRMHTRQYNLQGDPALRFYSPENPDIYLPQNAVFIKTPNLTTALDSITIGTIVRNKGKALTDSVSLSIRRTFKDNSIIDYGTRKIKPILNSDTVYYSFPMVGEKAQGNNTFSATVDSDQTFTESDELNNSTSNVLYIPGNGINLLFPKQLAIVNSQEVELIAQSSDLFTKSSTYLFEIDTTKTFNSSWKKTSSVTANALARTTVNILPENNKTYYWRSKLDMDSNDGGDWQTGKFTYVVDVEEGFAQKGDADAFNNSYKTLIYNPTNKRFEFEKTTHLVSLSTRGDDAPTSTERTFRSSLVGRLAFAGYEFESFTLVAIHPLNSTFFSYPSVNNYQNYPPDYTGQYFFNLANSTDVDSLVNYINRIPEGYFVVGFNGRNVNLKGMSQKAKEAFAKLGCLKINDIGAGEPYLFFGQKGFAPGLATEVTADYGSDIPPRSQNILLSKEYNPFFNTGYYNSVKIGPAKKWSKAYFDFEKESADVLNYQVIGITKEGTESTVLSNITDNEVNLSNINAINYPYLKLRALTTDNFFRTPAQLKSWKVAYEETPENTINLDLTNIFHAEEIHEGDSVLFKAGYQNISKHVSDSVKVYAILTTPQRTETKTLITTIKPLDPRETAQISYSTGTLGLNGSNNLRLEFDPKSDNDSYSFNNQVRKDFVVLRDNKEPIIDLTFDGKHIINREIVSPSPNIVISVKDENNFLLLNDTTVLEVSIKREDDPSFKRVYYSDGKLKFTPATSATENSATIFYKPDRLDDGIYVLQMRSKDNTGNYNQNSNFEISFEVINESTITNFYPYPNPVVNSMNFVFTLTGEVVPEKIKIQITNMNGKIVREILKEELGQLRIGNNKSDFTWDGTDQFGDRLANGVYFYKVFIENGSTETKHRYTVGDKYFKNQIGKIYLLK